MREEKKTLSLINIIFKFRNYETPSQEVSWFLILMRFLLLLHWTDKAPVSDSQILRHEAYQETIKLYDSCRIIK